MNQDKHIFDKEHVSKPIIFLKGIGRYCENPKCKKHIFGRVTKKYCSNKCRWKMNAIKNPPKDSLIVHCNVNLRTYGVDNKYRIVKVYFKRGVMHEVKITPQAKELWNLLEKIDQFRNISKPLAEIIA